jgi:hypothetical protein
MPGADLQYEWVKTHQVACTPWRCLKLEEQLITTCDMLANGAVTHALTLHPCQTGPMLQPLECMAMVVDGVKIRSQVALTVRFDLGKAAAQGFYTKATKQVQGSNKGGLG